MEHFFNSSWLNQVALAGLAMTLSIPAHTHALASSKVAEMMEPYPMVQCKP
jgi:hypothetical protein